MITYAGWLLAVALTIAIVCLYRELSRLGLSVARASHEIRNPLFGLQLMLSTAGRVPAADVTKNTVAAANLEIRKAALSLDDLAATTFRHCTLFQPVNKKLLRRVCNKDRQSSFDQNEVGCINVKAVIRNASESWNALARNYGTKITLKLPAEEFFVKGNEVRLIQACANLVSNALEHGKGSVEICVREVRDRIRIEVADSGCGLSRPLSVVLKSGCGEVIAGNGFYRNWRPRQATAARCELRLRKSFGRIERRGHGLAIVAKIATSFDGRLISAPTNKGARMVLEFPKAHRPVKLPSLEKATNLGCA